jgi:4-amino-4-deoxy-L-arabinose transferase-like glycosyltransferase
MNKKNHKLIFFLIIFVIAFLLRIYKFDQLFPFSMDEEYQAFLVKNIIVNKHVPLIGVNVADTGLYLGPFFTWFLTLPYFFSNLNPLSTAFVAAFLGGISAILFAILVSKISKDKFMGIIGGLVYALNPLINAWDRKLWNPSWVLPLALLWLLALTNIDKNKKWLLVLALVFGLAFHSHYSLFILLPTTIWFIFKKTSLKKSLKIIIKDIKLKKIKSIYSQSLTVFSICLLPLITFELRHGFVQLKSFFQFLSSGSGDLVQTFWDKIVILYQSMNRLLWLGFNKDLAYEISLASIQKSVIGLPIFFIFGLATFYIWKNKKIKQYAQLTLGVLVSYVVLFLIYPGKISEYYFLPLWPLLLLIGILSIAQLIKNHKIWMEYLLGLGLAGLFVLWAWQSLSLQNSLGFDKKIKILKYAQKYIGKSPYNLEVVGNYKYEGYRYIAEFLDFTPASSYMDENFSWIYSSKCEKSPRFDLAILHKIDTNDKKTRLEWGRWQKSYGQLRLNTKIENVEIVILKRK